MAACGSARAAGGDASDDAAPAYGAQRGVGAKYGARDPRTCASKKAPSQGAPSTAQATAYFVCASEGESGSTLNLYENVKVEVGKGTPYKQLDLGARPSDGDFDGTVYTIRGSFQHYTCSVPDMFTKAGENCTRYDVPTATGTCYRTNFGDWSCQLYDRSIHNYGTMKQPAPRS